MKLPSVPVRFITCHHDNLQFSLQQHFLQPVRSLLIHPKVKLGIFFIKLWKNLRKNASAPTGGGANGQISAFHGFDVCNLLLKIPVQFYNLFCIFQILFSCIGRNHFLTYTFKKLNPIQFLCPA